MLPESVVRALLISRISEVGPRVSPFMLPLTFKELPALTYFLPHEKNRQHSVGLSSTYAATIEIDCWHPTYQGARELAARVRDELAAASFSVGGVTVSSFVEQETTTYPPDADAEHWHASISFSFFWQKE